MRAQTAFHGHGGGSPRSRNGGRRADQVPVGAGGPRHPAGQDVRAGAGRRANRPADLRPLRRAADPEGRRAGERARHLGALRQGGAAADRHQPALQGPAGAGPVGHQEPEGRHVPDADRQRLRLEGQLARRHADVPHREAGLEGGHGRARLDHVPERSRPQGAVPHRQREHAQAVPDRLGFRHRIDPADRRRAVVRRRVRPVPDQDRQERQGAGRLRRQGRRQGRALARQSLPRLRPARPA